MGMFSWLKKSAGGPGAEATAWHQSWAQAVVSLDGGAVAGLDAALHRTPPFADDLEIEEEMLDGLRRLLDLEGALAQGRLPLIETAHRVVGADRCHFSAPVSIPDDPAQPTGRLLLTSGRAVFAGSARTPSLPWHAAREVVQSGRDIVLVTRTVEEPGGYRYRCNSYAEALCGAAIARHLMRAAQGRL